MLRYLMAYPKKNFSYPGPSMWFSNRINWIISDVQAKNFFLIIFLASNKVLAMLGSWIGTCSVFFHSYSVSPGVCSIKIEWLLFLKFLKILAFFDSYFWPFNKSEEKIKVIFVISVIMPSIWNVFIKFCWHDEKLTNMGAELQSQNHIDINYGKAFSLGP